MKKTLIAVSAFMLMTLLSPSLQAANLTTAPISEVAPTKAEERSAILARVYEIKNADKSKLTSSEKKGLRTELKSLKKRYRDNGGVYISVGGVIIIILLLVLILR